MGINHKHKKIRSKIGLTFTAVALVVSMQTATANAVGSGYVASDVLGQLDGGGNPSFTTSSYGLGAGQLWYPTGSAIDTVHHRLFVGQDSPNYRVTVFNLDTNNNLVDHTADYIIGQPNFASNTYSTTQNGGAYQYAGVLYDNASDRLFVTDNGNSRILIYDLSGGITNGMNAAYVLGQPDFVTANTGVTQNTMQRPGGIAYDPIGHRLFVGDFNNSRVMVYDFSGGITNGMNAAYVLGEPDFVTNNTPHTTQNGLYGPQDVAYNPNTKQLFVADTYNARVVVYDLSGGITNGMNATYVLGQPDFTSNAASTTQSGLSSNVWGIGLDSFRNVLYVGDASNNRVMVYNLSAGITNGMNATLVLGQPNFTSSTAATTQTGLSHPDGNIGVDPTNNRIYVSDANNNRLMIYNFANIRNTTGSAVVAGTTSINTEPGTAFYLKLTASGVQGTATFALTGGALPPGLTLNTATGEITGTPTKTGSYTFEITTYDNLGAIGTYVEDPTFTINVAGTAAPGAPDTGYPKVSVLPAWQPVLILIGMLGIGLVARKIATR